MITGGLGGRGVNVSKKAEIYVPSTNSSCILPDLPNSRYYHSQVGLRACGGLTGRAVAWGDTCDTTCDTWNPETGSWDSKDVRLNACRARNSWTTSDGEGTYLIGGFSYYSGNGNTWDNTKSSELLRPDGKVTQGFKLTSST